MLVESRRYFCHQPKKKRLVESSNFGLLLSLYREHFVKLKEHLEQAKYISLSFISVMCKIENKKSRDHGAKFLGEKWQKVHGTIRWNWGPPENNQGPLRWNWGPPENNQGHLVILHSYPLLMSSTIIKTGLHVYMIYFRFNCVLIFVITRKPKTIPSCDNWLDANIRS